MFFGVLIFCNCATMSIEVEILLGRMQGWRTFLDVSEQIYTAFFVLEVCLRFAAFGWRYYAPGGGGSWSDFGDLCVVSTTGVLAVWILPLFDSGGDGASSELLQALTVLRALRLVRIVRVVARIELFHEVWLLLRGLSESCRVLFWTVVVIFLITYIFAVFGVPLLSVRLQEQYHDQEDEVLGDLIEMTDGVMALVFTLLQVLTLDSWTQIVRDMARYIPWCCIYFFLYVAIAVFVLMNLVTAIIVENALNSSKQDEEAVVAEKERERQKELCSIRHLFEMIDVDGNGVLTRTEFQSAFEDPEVATKLKFLNIQQKDCMDMFNLLDSGDGVLSLEEFFEGLRRMEGLAQAKDVFRMGKIVENLLRSIRHHSLVQEKAVSPEIEQGLKPSENMMLQKLEEVMKAVSACNSKVEALAAEFARAQDTRTETERI